MQALRTPEGDPKEAKSSDETSGAPAEKETIMWVDAGEGGTLVLYCNGRGTRPVVVA